MLTMIEVALVALLAGVVVGWVASASRVARATAERDAARAERERSEMAVREARRRGEEAQQARAAAEARLANQKQVEDTFTALAQSALKNVGESLVQMNKQQVDGSLGTLLTPVREMVDNYRSELQKSENARNASYGSLQEQIRGLLGVQESAQREASRLANALQSPTFRGSWGEISLRRCVELSGMSEYCDFTMQETVEGEDGRRLRPDMLVRMPNNRIIAVDSKAPTHDYTSAAQAMDEETRKGLLAAHTRNLKRHVDALAKKEYQAAISDTLDFVVMFLPGDQFVASAGPDLFEYAAEKKVYIASPTLLLPLLRVVHAGWKVEKTEENAKRMHDAGVELFNRFVKVMEHISNVGSALQTTVNRYNESIRSIDSRLWPKGEEMQRMAGSGKELAALDQLEAVPLQSSKLRLTMQSEDEAVILPMER
ncbi:MAG TPA: DNA recombination protein RmuC [Thermoanaerobaculia bacterium]|nr:DNA recombination protein RmuC [Thermoanaerobaculia bacterium]